MLDFLFTTRFLINSWAFPFLNKLWSLSFFLYFLFLFIKGQLKINVKLLFFFSLASVYLLCFTIFSPSYIIFWRQYYIFAFGFLGLAIGMLLDQEKLIRAFLFSAFIVSLVSLYAFFIGRAHVLFYLDKFSLDNSFARYFLHQKRAFFPFLLPNSLGAFMSLAFIINLCQKGKEKERIWQIVLGAVFLLLVILSRSLGSLVCLAIVVGIYLLKRRKNKIKFMVFCLVAILLVLVVLMLRQHSIYIATPYFSFRQRVRFWKEAFVFISQRPMWGIGVGGYYLYTGVMYCHNVFLQMWLDYGFLGFLGFLALAIYFILKSLSLIKREPGNYIFLGIFLANLFFLLHNLVDIDFYIFQLSFIWFVILGMIYRERN